MSLTDPYAPSLYDQMPDQLKIPDFTTGSVKDALFARGCPTTKYILVQQEAPKKRSETLITLTANKKKGNALEEDTIKSPFWRVLQIAPDVTAVKVGDAIVGREMIVVELEDWVGAICHETRILYVIAGGLAGKVEEAIKLPELAPQVVDEGAGE